jgi:L-lactate dehydrogenase (cytochrome)
LYYGQPSFATLKKYMPKGLNTRQLGAYMNATFSGRVNEAEIAPIRDRWKGNLVLKGMDNGVRSGPDIARTLASGADFAFLGRTFMYAVAALGTEG